ncbi:MAG: maleylpyruvate isomerase family mycothiol-dependent enzyme [Deltaproteobacteria bacterium]|nr:maleylpyruvate isomerase family mycothiol-dependent enzyme [Deltaproteobacteria bacterium]
MDAAWDMVAAERLALVDDLDRMTAEQWLVPSALPGWQVRHVVAHLLWPLETSLPRMLWRVARCGFRVLGACDAAAESDVRAGPELSRALRAHARDPRFRPPGCGIEVPLTEVTVHALDIRVPLGIPFAVPAEHARIALDLLVSRRSPRGFTPPHLVDGLRFQAEDLGWARGEGPEVSGPADALLLSITGRPALLDRLRGDGVPAFRGRLRPPDSGTRS